MESQNPQAVLHLESKQNQTEFQKASDSSSIYEIFANSTLKLRKNLTFQSIWTELNGAMGDLGTYIPIVLAMSLAKGLDLGTTLIFTGIFDILAGVIYGVPMAVQPMKSIVTVAMSNDSDNFGIQEVMAAGICTGGIMLVLGALGVMELFYKLIPLSVVRGIQLAQGLSFAVTAIRYILKNQDFSSLQSVGDDRRWVGLDGLVLALVCACFIVIVNGAGDDSKENDESKEIIIATGELGFDQRSVRVSRRLREFIVSLPCAFMIFSLGMALAFLRNPKVVNSIRFGPSSILAVKISRLAWKNGFIKGTIPQLPLTILNSVIAVCRLTSDLFPEKKVSVTLVSTTIGIMNVVGCWFGAVPCCHGAGGLAGHYKFGGRSGGCVVLLGITKLVMGLVLGTSLLKLLSQFPVGVLGVMLLFAAIELAMASRDMKNSKEEAFVMLICTSVSLACSTASLGFVCGIVVYLILKLRNFSHKDQVESLMKMCGFKKHITDQAS